MAMHSITIACSVALCLLFPFPSSVLSIGVCYGMLGNNLPTPGDVISIYKTRNIEAMRLYDANKDVLQALNGSNIHVLLGVPNELLQLFASDSNAANTWVQSNVAQFSPAVHFRYIAVGNEVIPGNLAQFVLPAMANVWYALFSAGLHGKIKVSTSVSQAVLGASYPPSAGAFTSEAQPFLGTIARFLEHHGAPLLVNLYPFFAYAGNAAKVPLDYALFTSRGSVVSDGKLNYSNLFDAMVDSVHSALEKIGGERVEVVVSETGWPSAGGAATTIRNAQAYNTNLIKHVQQGTPKRPGKIEAYIFAMFNENQKSAGVGQSWGLFYPNKEPVYPVEFL